MSCGIPVPVRRTATPLRCHWLAAFRLVNRGQLLGLALGLSPKQVGVHENISDSLGFLKEKGLA